MESEVPLLFVIMITLMMIIGSRSFVLAFALSFLLTPIALSFSIIFFLLLNPQAASCFSIVSAKPSSLIIISRECCLNVAY